MRRSLGDTAVHRRMDVRVTATNRPSSAVLSIPRSGLPVILVIDAASPADSTITTAARAVHAEIIVLPNASSALKLLARTSVDLILLSSGTAPIDADVDVCRSMRRISAAFLIIVAENTNEDSKIAALNAGADDYLVKPFSVREFEARVAAHIRRAQMRSAGPPGVIHVRGLVIDLARRRVTRGSKTISLSRKEWAVLEVLAQNSGIPVSHEEMFSAVWKKPFAGHQNYLSVYVTLLRRKLERIRSEPEIIMTAPGFGYWLADSD